MHFSHPEVVKRLEQIINNIKRKTSGAVVSIVAVAAAEETKCVKIERRDGYVNRSLEQQATEGNHTVQGTGVAAFT